MKRKRIFLEKVTMKIINEDPKQIDNLDMEIK